jgi:hypothetical protein
VSESREGDILADLYARVQSNESEIASLREEVLRLRRETSRLYKVLSLVIPILVEEDRGKREKILKDILEVLEGNGS